MATFRFSVIEVPPVPGPLQGELNRLGADGWEVATSFEQDGKAYVVLQKRDDG